MFTVEEEVTRCHLIASLVLKKGVWVFGCLCSLRLWRRVIVLCVLAGWDSFLCIDRRFVVINESFWMAGFMAISAQILNVYHLENYGTWLYTSYSHRLRTLAAVLYVDDTDLIHTTPSINATPRELISHTQLSTNTWGGLAIATGVSLKPEKCLHISSCTDSHKVVLLLGVCAAFPNLLRPSHR